MKIKDKIGSPASSEKIKMFEENHGFNLPDDYRSFLQSQNGGRPEMACRVFTFHKEDGSLSDSLVDWFSGLIESDEYSLEEDLEVYEGRIPLGMLPIACDPFGNLILLGVRDYSISGVWFWDHEIEPTDISEPGIYKVSSSFGQFIESLRAVPWRI